MNTQHLDRLWDAVWDEAFPPDHFDRMRRVELAITGDGKVRVDRAHGTLATEALPVIDLTVIAPTAGSAFDTAHDQVAAVTGGYVPGGTDVAVADGGTGASTAAGALANLGAAPLASPTFTGTVSTTGPTNLGDSAADLTTITGQMASSGSAPSVAIGAAAGTGASVGTITGNDISGHVVLNTGTGTGTGTLCTVTFANARAAIPNMVMVGQFAATGGGIDAYVTSVGTASFVIGARTAPTASVTITVGWIVL